MRAEKPASLSIGALSKATNVKVETIRYYERIGLMEEPRRTQGGNRVYDRDEAAHLGFIRRCRELGFPLAEVRTLIALSEMNDPNCRQTRDITMRQLDIVRGKIASLKRLERTLRDMARACTPGDQTRCPIIEALNIE